RQDLAIQARHARLALRDDLGLERSLPIARRDDLDFAELPLQSFLAFPVAPVAIRLRLLVMLFISQVGCHLRFQRPFHQRLGQLPQQTVLAGQILRLPVVCQQAVDYFLFNCHWFSKSVGEPAITQSVLYPRRPARQKVSCARNPTSSECPGSRPRPATENALAIADNND